MKPKYIRVKGNYKPIVDFIKLHPKWKGLLTLYYKTEVDDENYLDADRISIIDSFSSSFELTASDKPDIIFDGTFKKIG